MNWVSPIKDDATLDKFKRVLKECDIKYYIMFELGLNSGLQLKDVLELKYKDVINKNELVSYIGTKKVKVVFTYSADFKHILTDYAKGKNPDAYLISGYDSSDSHLSREQAYRVLKTVGRTVGITSLGAQTMRKTFAYRYYKQTKDIYFLQNMLNHAAPSITYRYIGEKPQVQLILSKLTPEENERSRFALYINNSGRHRINNIIDTLTEIRENFDNHGGSDAFYGRVDCLLEQLEDTISQYKNNNK